MKIRDITRDFENDVDAPPDTPDRWSLYDRYRTAKDNAIGEQHVALEAQRAVLGIAWLLVFASSTARSHWPVAHWNLAGGFSPEHGSLWEPRAKDEEKGNLGC